MSHLSLYTIYIFLNIQTDKKCFPNFWFCSHLIKQSPSLVYLSASDWPTAVWQDHGSDREWEERGSQAGVWWISCGREEPLCTPHHLFWGQGPHAHRQGRGNSLFQFIGNKLALQVACTVHGVCVAELLLLTGSHRLHCCCSAAPACPVC